MGLWMGYEKRHQAAERAGTIRKREASHLIWVLHLDTSCISLNRVP